MLHEFINMKLQSGNLFKGLNAGPCFPSVGGDGKGAGTGGQQLQLLLNCDNANI